MGRVWQRAGRPVRHGLAVLAWLVMLALPALAAERVQLHATAEAGFGRLVLQFPDRLDLPDYKVGFDNNVLSVTFDEPVTLPLPDVGAMLGDYLTIGRVDPDGRGVRFGLRAAVNIHSMEAGEKLFIDMMPPGWQGLPPALPPAVVAELTERAKATALLAEQTRKAEEARALNPQASLHIGHAPTFFRIEFAWSADTEATFRQDGAAAQLVFDWPVPIDLYALKADMPVEILGAANDVSVTGSTVNLSLAEGVTPRFYAVDKRHFTLDIDLTAAEAGSCSTAEAAARAAEAEAAAARARRRGRKAARPTRRRSPMPHGARRRAGHDHHAGGGGDRRRCVSPFRSSATSPRRCSGAATRCGCCSTPVGIAAGALRRARCHCLGLFRHSGGRDPDRTRRPLAAAGDTGLRGAGVGAVGGRRAAQCHGRWR